VLSAQSCILPGAAGVGTHRYKRTITASPLPPENVVRVSEMSTIMTLSSTRGSQHYTENIWTKVDNNRMEEYYHVHAS
jgi:hypothetical protein